MSRTLPILEVEIAGSKLSGPAQLAISEIRIQQKLSQPTLCELLFLGLSPNSTIASPGDDITVRSVQETLFSGDVTAVEYAYDNSSSLELRLRCYDRLQRLRKRQKVRSYVEARLDELIQDLTTPDGITVQCTAALPVLRHLVQWRRSDFDLLADLTERFGVYFWLDGSVLRVSQLASQLNPIQLELGRNLLRAHFEINGDESCSAVRATGWDPAHSEPRSGEVHAQTANAIAPPSLQTANLRGQLDPKTLHADPLRFLVNHTADDATQTELIAQGELDRRVARGAVFSGLADGSARFRPGARVDLQGAAPGLGGEYVLTSVVHRIEPRAGYVSELSTEPPADPKQFSGGAGVSMGIVTQVQDPERRGRVRVRLAGYDDSESGWLPVVLPGIGEGKGFIAVPNVGDTVLILEPRGDPSHSIVIGGLTGPGATADMGVQDERVKRFFIRTAAPHTLSFDDFTHTIRLEDSSKNSLEFSPEGVVLHAANNMRIEAPGKAIKIMADKIDFERG